MLKMGAANTVLIFAFQDREFYGAYNEPPPLSKGNTMMFAGIDNAYGTAAFEPAATPTRTVYYKTIRLDRKPRVRLPRAPKPPSHHLKNFLLTFDK